VVVRFGVGIHGAMSQPQIRAAPLTALGSCAEEKPRQVNYRWKFIVIGDKPVQFVLVHVNGLVIWMQPFSFPCPRLLEQLDDFGVAFLLRFTPNRPGTLFQLIRLRVAVRLS